ncbi:MAG TPA: hypothetical protein VNQ90_18975 [Chthoniobacteraceae bacterium]|nr:hypothetical protein [Chthoniobacteraceae bacterium]
MKAIVLSCFLAAALLLLPGCQTAPPRGASPFPEPGADWTTLVGQLRYVTPERAVIGEVVVSYQGEEHFQLDFLAGPGVPLMRWREAGSRAEAEGLFARGYWHGSPQRAGRLGSWARLSDVFSGVEKQEGVVESMSVGTSPTEWKARKEWSGGHLKQIAIDFPSTSERFIFVFAR